MYRPTLPFIVAMTALAMIAFAGAASADDTLRWNHPGQYVDENTSDTVPAQPLSAADIQATVIRVFASATATEVLSVINVERALSDDPNAPPPTSVVIPRESVVTVATVQCYDASTLMKVSAGGRQSEPSARVCKTVNPPPPRKPKRPTNVTVS